MLDRKQYYLEKYSPSLNINRFASSIMGYKHTDEKLSSTRRGKSYKKSRKGNPRPLVNKLLLN